MKSFLVFLSLLSVIAGGGAVAYYYGFYLPQKDVQAQQKAYQQANPTPEQREAQKQADLNALHQQDAMLNAYSKCMSDYTKAMSVFLDSKCPASGYDMMKNMNCRSDAMASFSYRDCREELF